MESPRILRIGDLMRLTGLSKATIYRQIQTGSMPRQVRLARRAVGWHATEIQAWIERRPRSDDTPPSLS